MQRIKACYLCNVIPSSFAAMKDNNKIPFMEQIGDKNKMGWVFAIW